VAIADDEAKNKMIPSFFLLFPLITAIDYTSRGGYRAGRRNGCGENWLPDLEPPFFFFPFSPSSSPLGRYSIMARSRSDLALCRRKEMREIEIGFPPPFPHTRIDMKAHRKMEAGAGGIFAFPPPFFLFLFLLRTLMEIFESVRRCCPPPPLSS